MGSIYDDVEGGGAEGGDSIFAESNDLVVPDWDVKKEGGGGGGGGGGGRGSSGEGGGDSLTGGISVDQTVVVCGKKTTKSTLTKLAGAL